MIFHIVYDCQEVLKIVSVINFNLFFRQVFHSVFEV